MVVAAVANAAWTAEESRGRIPARLPERGGGGLAEEHAFRAG